MKNFTSLMPVMLAQVDLNKSYGFGYIQTIGQGFSYLVTPGFSVAGVALVFYFLFAVFKIITSGGEKEALQSARNMITHAIIGFVLLMFIFILIKFFTEFFGLEGYKIIQ